MNLIKSILILVILLLCTCVGTSQNNDKLVGEWNGTDLWNNKSDFIFTAERNVIFTINGQKFGGDDFEINGIRSELKYELDLNQKPIWIDLIAFDKESKTEKIRIKGILKFKDENNAEILLSFDGNRLESFDKIKEESIIQMKRKK